MALGIGQAVNFFCIVLAAKYLAPIEYGAYSTGMIIIAFTAILSRFGVLEAIVQIGADTVDKTSTAAFISLGFSLASWLATGLAGYLLSIVWGTPSLALLAIALGVSSLSYGLQSLPEALLRKDLEFRKIALIRLGANLAGGMVLTAWIWLAPSMWALVAQRVVTEVTTTLLLWLATCPRIRLAWSRDYAGDVLRFSRGIGSANIVDVLGTQLDQIIVRIFWGEHGLGLYAMAKRLLANAQQFLFMPFRQVAVAALAGFEGNVDRMRQGYLRGTRLVMAAGVLAAWTAFFGTDPLIQLLFSSQWLECIIILKVLCWSLIYDSIVIMYPAVLQASRKPHWIAWERLALVVVGSVALCFIALSGYPIQSAAYSVLIQSFGTLPLVIWFMWRVLGGYTSWLWMKNLLVYLALVSITFLVLRKVLALEYFGTETFIYFLKLAVPVFISITILSCHLRFGNSAGIKSGV
jgi:PST family polysaccharide transporter